MCIRQTLFYVNCLFFLSTGFAHAVCTGGPQVFTCSQEATYLAKLTELGYNNVFLEGFEGTAWDIARSTNTPPNDTAPSVLSQGITWTTNHPLTNEISTSNGAARSGLWGVLDPDHGDATGTIAECDVPSPPEKCFSHDGFSGSIPAPDVIYGIGGYITGFAGSDVDILIDGNAQNGGTISVPGYVFMGVIDTAGFNSFEYREVEGQVEQLLFISGDDFTIATSATQPGNNAPVLAAIGDQTTDENVALSVPLSASDADGDNLSFSMSGEPAGATLSDNGDGTADYIWTPNYSQAGSYSVTFTVSDSALPAATDSETITITVNDVNRPPVLSAIGDKSVAENTLLTIQLSASDPDGDSLSFSKSTGPTGSSLVDNGNGTATFSWTPDIGTAGDYPVTFTVTDNGVPTANDAESIIITVIASLVDVTPPMITLLGDNPMNVEQGGSYIEPGATATDNVDGDISANVVIAGTVNTSVIDTYNVTYNVSDAAGNPATEVTRTVNVTAVAAGTLQFSASMYSVSEIGNLAIITVTRVDGSSGAVGVSYTSSDGTATAGSDYTAVSGSLSFSDGETSRSFTVPILDDVDYEGDETVNLALSSPTGGAGLSLPTTSVLTISEDDPVPPTGSLQFSTATYTVGENGATATIIVTRVGGSTGVVGVSYTSSNGSASAGSDYTAVSGSLSFADGETSRSFTVPILDDVVYEGDETVNLALSNPTGGAGLGSPATSVLTITEDDPVSPSGSLQFSAATFSVDENGATVTITVTRTGGSSGAVSVDYASSDGSATAGSDYTAVSNSLDFADGELSQTFTVSLLDDVTYEGDETVNLSLSNPTGGAGLGSPATVVLTIAEDDPVPSIGSLQFSAPTYTVDENGATASVTVTRTGGSFGVVGVDYASSDSSATAGSDYTAVSSSLSFADGELSRTFTVPILDDVVFEGDEVVNLSLSNPTGGAGLGSPATASLTIVEDETQSDSGKSSGSISLITLFLLFVMSMRQLWIRNHSY